MPRWRRSTSEIEIHASSLPADERTVLDGIPITTVSRTLLDLATLLDPIRLLSAINQAKKREMTSPLSLPELLERHRGERGTPLLGAALRDIGYGVTDHELEARFADFVSQRGLPRPELNAWVRAADRNYRADCLWRQQRLIVEPHSAAITARCRRLRATRSVTAGCCSPAGA